MSENRYDLIVIGAGPGGYLAAERAGALGKKVLLIEKDARLGGVCLNRGCIPTKTLLNSAKIYYKAQNSALFGVTVSEAKYDLSKALVWKDKTVDLMTRGVAYQMKRHNVETLRGKAEFNDRNSVTVADKTYYAHNFIIASGSSPIKPPIEGIEEESVVTSDEIFKIRHLPKKLAIIGGGVIGLEFASYFSMIGVEVAVLEALPEIIPNVDAEIAKNLRSSLKKCEIITDAKVLKIAANGVYYRYKEKEKFCDADLVLLAAGRTPNVENFGLHKLNLHYSAKGIVVNEKMQTNIPNIYAVGDVTGKSLLAHSAYRMGEVAVNVMFGSNDRMRYHAVPWVIYTNPELAGVGITEKEALERGYNIRTQTMQLRANGRFYAEHANEKGLCKVVVDADSDLLLGVFILGGVSSEIIYGAAVMIEAELRVKDIKEIIFPHPTVSEALKDTLWELTG